MFRILEFVLLGIGVAVIIAISYWLGQQAYSWMPVQATTDAKHVDDLFSFLVTLSSIIFLSIAGMMLYSVIFCRARKGDYREGHPTRGDRKIEFLWTATPVALVLWIASYSFYMYGNMEVSGPTKILGHLHMLEEPAYADTGTNDTQSTEIIEVISKQWSWTFRYPQQNFTSTELHLPVNQRAHLLLKSEDVLHGFYVPEFRIKQDIIPNRSIDFQFIPTRVGKYRLHDSEFSGTYFAVMEADVYVDSPEDYSRWLSQAANHEKIPASNLAASEHIQPPNRLLKTNWKSIPPAEPPIVNYSS